MTPYLGEEGIVVRELVHFLVIIARFADIEYGLHIRVHEPVIDFVSECASLSQGTAYLSW